MSSKVPVPPPKSRLRVKREGRDITRTLPLPTVITDTREQRPFDFTPFPMWIGGVETRGLPTGDYSIAGMENILALERKSLADIIGSVTQGRARFLNMCERLAEFRHKAILIEASYQDIKSPYADEVYSDADYKQYGEGSRLFTKAHPNGVSGTLDSINARFGIEIIYTSRIRELAAERAASWLSKQFVYFHLEKTGLGRFLQEGDL